MIKVSIITSCYNRENTIRNAIESVLNQDYPNIEYIIIDGASTDNSLSIIKEYKDKINTIISEPDKGMYEAINKGLKIANGDIIGLVHSDDVLFDNNTISNIVNEFTHTQADIIYGNGIFVSAENSNKIIRNWISGNFKHWKVHLGWLPLHPTVYIKQNIIKEKGTYNENYKIAADTDFLIRILYKTQYKVHYINQYIIKMRMGGLSTDNKKRKQMWNEDIQIFKSHGFWTIPTKIMKMSWKIPQFIKALFT